MLDTLVHMIVATGLGFLLLLASMHKFSHLSVFEAVLTDYQLVPGSLVPTVARLVPGLELALGFAWLVSYQRTIVAIASAGLLVVYAAAIAINLRRGRVHIGCGCGFGGSTEDEQPLSSGLVIRNLVLVIAALSAIIPANERALGVVDYLTLVTALLTLILIFVASNQLIRNGVAIRLQRGKGRHHHD